MPDLHLPGDIPNLLRPTSPVIATDLLLWEDGQLVEVGTPGVVVSLLPKGRALVAWTATTYPDDEDGGPLLLDCDLSQVALDLTRDTGRSHAAGWLAVQVSNLHAAAVWGGTVWKCTGIRLWTLCSAHHREHFGTAAVPSNHIVPALDTLKYTDNTRLPDNSREVDARALREVVRHIAKVSA